MNGVCIIKSDDDIYNSQLRRVQRNMKLVVKKGIIHLNFTRKAIQIILKENYIKLTILLFKLVFKFPFSIRFI